MRRKRWTACIQTNADRWTLPVSGDTAAQEEAECGILH